MRFPRDADGSSIEWPFEAAWFMDEVLLRKAGRSRADFVGAIQGDWFPVLVRGGSEITKTIDLEFGRTIVERVGNPSVILEYRTTASTKWHRLGKFHAYLRSDDYRKGGGMMLASAQRGTRKLHPDHGYDTVF